MNTELMFSSKSEKWLIDASGRGPENRKEVLTMTEYIENPLSGKLRGVTYEDGKIIDVHIRDTDDVVKVFVPVRHGRWIDKGEYAVCTECGGRSGTQYDGVELIPLMTQFCPNCGARMDGGAD